MFVIQHRIDAGKKWQPQGLPLQATGVFAEVPLERLPKSSPGLFVLLIPTESQAATSSSSACRRR